jgi:hypothetical protein
MKERNLQFIKSQFLISDDALKNWKIHWRFLWFLECLLLQIANHQYDAKNYRITELT